MDKDFILNIVEKNINHKVQDYDEDLISIGMDSLNMINIIVDIEDALKIRIPDSMLLEDNFKTLNNIFQSIQKITS